MAINSLLKIMGVALSKFCKKGHKYQFFPGGRCVVCYWNYHKLKNLLRKIEKRKQFMYSVWVNSLQGYYDFEYFVALEGQKGELANLYIEAEKLI